MNIAVIELGDSHMENLYTLVHFIRLKGHQAYLIINAGLRPLVRETEKLSGLFEVPDHIVKSRRQRATYKKVASLLKEKKIDQIIFGTMEAKAVRNLLPFLRGYPMVGIVHDAQKIDNSATFRYLYPLWVRKYLVFGHFIKSQIKKYPPQRLHPFFPIYFPSPGDKELKKPEAEKWIIIPGGVSDTRKDYEALLGLLAKRPLPHNATLIFLGRLDPNDTLLNQRIAVARQRGSRIRTFSEYLDYDLFHSYMAAADWVLPLLKMEKDMTYGNSRVSGAFHLAYAYRLPLLLPASYKINTDLADYSIYYDSIEDFHVLLSKALKDDTVAGQIHQRYDKAPMFDDQKAATLLMDFLAST